MCPNHPHEHFSFHMAHLVSPASGQMSDYMDAQCNGTEHADKLATLQQLQKCCVGEKRHDGISTSVLLL